MSLDQSLPTLLVGQRVGKPGWVDFVSKDRSSADYAAVKEEEKIYLIDALSEAHHATLTPLTSKLKLIELQSPPFPVELKSTSMLWEWSFVWEEQKYSWRREAVGLGSQRGYTLYANFGKGDPDFSVAIYRPGKMKGSLQQLGYNLRRIEPAIKDLKGFEILVLLSLIVFLDHYFISTLPAPNALDPATEAHLKSSSESKGKGKESAPPPPVPVLPARTAQPPPQPKPQPAMDPNEVEIRDPKLFAAYTQRSLSLLEDKNLLYMTLISRNPSLAGAAVSMAEEIKRTHYKKTGEELMTFAQTLEDGEAPKSPVPPPSSSKRHSYVPPPPPSALKIFISRITLDLAPPSSNRPPTVKKKGPDLRPPIVFGQSPPVPPMPISGGGGKLVKGREKEKEKDKEEEGKGWFSWK